MSDEKKANRYLSVRRGTTEKDGGEMTQINERTTRTLRAAIAVSFRPGRPRLRRVAPGVEPGRGRAPCCRRARRIRRRRRPGGPVCPRAGDAHRPAGHRPRRRIARAARWRDAAADPAHAEGAHRPGGRTARTEAGALWQDVTIPARQHGLAALAGTSPNVGVTGYTLGGGIGWLARRYGLAANSLTAAEIEADGRLVRADADHEPDLFWALRGGGGSVGVVTALEMKRCTR